MNAIPTYGFVIDNRRCIGCHACTVACKAEHADPIGVNKTWVKYIEKGTFPDTNRNFSVNRCNHCADSPCTDVCPVTALWERDDGIVDFDAERCIGCKACMQGCPYDALYIDPETHTAAKCNYCSHRVDTGREPACVTVCPEDAIIPGDLDNPETEISEVVADQEVQVRKPEKGTDPKLFYVDGDDASTTPGGTAREEHYMWSDAPRRMPTRGIEREEFDLERAARSLAESDVPLGTADGGHEGAEARADGGCACSGSCGCGDDGGRMASDGGTAVSSAGTDTSGEDGRAARAYELLTEEARRVYDIGENHYRSWGWEVYGYTWTKSIAAGAFLIPSVLMLLGLMTPDATIVGASATLAAVFLGITGILLVLDLEQPRRFHWVLLRPNWRSWLVKGAYIITGYGAYLGLVILGWLAGVEAVTHPVVLAIGAILAVSTAVYTAFLFSQSKGRDLWQSPAMPLHMATQAVIAGAASLVIVGALAGLDVLVGSSTGLLLGGIVLHAALVGSEIFTPHQTEDAEEAAARITRGPFSRAFWFGGMLLGIAAPAAMLLTGGGLAAALGASVLALIGLLAYEYCWIVAPQTISLA